MIERARLVPSSGNVNVLAVATALAFLAACSSETAETPERNASIPLIWQTSPLTDRVNDFALLDADPLQMAVAYENRTTELRDTDGLLSGQAAPIALDLLGTGQRVDVDGTELDLFPGVRTQSGDLAVIAMAEGLVAPFDISVDMPIDPNIEGFCASPSDAPGSLFRIAYWSGAAPGRLVLGKLRLEGDQISYAETGERLMDRYITACALNGTSVAVAGAFGLVIADGDEQSTLVEVPNMATALTLVNADDKPLTAVAVLMDRELWAADAEGRSTSISLEPAISFGVPSRIGNLTALSNGNMAALPRGFVAMQAQTGDGEPRVLFIDLGQVLDAVASGPSAED